MVPVKFCTAVSFLLLCLDALQDANVPTIATSFNSSTNLTYPSQNLYNETFHWSYNGDYSVQSLIMSSSYVTILYRCLLNHEFYITNSNNICSQSWNDLAIQFYFGWLNDINTSYIGDNFTINNYNCLLYQNIPESKRLYITYISDHKIYLPVRFEYYTNDTINENNLYLRYDYFNFDISSINKVSSEIFTIPSSCNYSDGYSLPYGLFDGFESSDFNDGNDNVGSFWIPCGDDNKRWVCGHIYPQSNIVRSGNYSANITIQPGDIYEKGENGDKDSERDELDSRAWNVLNQDIWYGFSFYIPSNAFPIVNDRLVMGQWKQNSLGDVSPLFAQRFVNNEWYFTLYMQGYNETIFDMGINSLTFDEWHDLIFNFKFTSNEKDGYVNVWHNHSQIIQYKGKTAYDDQGTPQFYHKFGLYRDVWNSSWTIFFDNYSIGKSKKQVDPSRFD